MKSSSNPRARACLAGSLLLALTPAMVQAQSFAYVANQSNNTISGYRIDVSTGALTALPDSPFPGGVNPLSLAVDPSGRFAYVTNYTGNCGGFPDTISAYTIDATTGTLAPIDGSPFPAGQASYELAVDPSGRFLYVANICDNNISAYTIDASTGALAPIPGSPFSAGTGPISVAVDPQGRFAYVSNMTSNDVSAYRIEASTGALEQVDGSPFPAGINPLRLTVDPAGRFVYVPNAGAADISVFSIDGGTGALASVPGSPFTTATGPQAAMVDPTGRFVYVAGGPANVVNAYTSDATTGALTPIPGSPFEAGGYPFDVAVDSTGSFAYIADDYSNQVSAYTIDAISGALTPIAGSPFLAGSHAASVTTVTFTAQSYSALVRPPVNPDGSSVFSAKRGVIPIKFTLAVNGTPTCELPPATISLSRTAGGTLGVINEGEYLQPSDVGSNFRVSECEYIYSLGSKSLGLGTYLVHISIGSATVGTATFSLK